MLFKEKNKHFIKIVCVRVFFKFFFYCSVFRINAQGCILQYNIKKLVHLFARELIELHPATLLYIFGKAVNLLADISPCTFFWHLAPEQDVRGEISPVKGHWDSN